VNPDRSRFDAPIARTDKPWGYELRFVLTERYCGKILFVQAGESLSLQYHERKDEAWYVLEGRALLLLGDLGGPLAELTIEPGQAFRFSPRTVHRVTALADTRILEVSTPEVEDVVRLEDRYGRA
jgi:mannose-6-phosphate isomerase-like protein (cupin superfamily)